MKILGIIFGAIALSSTLYQDAYQHYVQGENAQTVTERNQEFNLALSLYREIERENSPTFGNGKLYYNIANSYFQLGEYPLAILYYHRALRLMPRSKKIEQNLQVAKNKLNLPRKRETRIIDFTFFSIPERLQLFTFFTLLTLVFISLNIWFGSKIWKSISYFFGVLALLILLTLGYSQYLAPIHAIIIKPSGLYRDAGKQYAKVTETPLSEGIKVKVLGLKKEGTWLKVQTQDEKIGFVPEDKIRMI